MKKKNNILQPDVVYSIWNIYFRGERISIDVWNLFFNTEKIFNYKSNLKMSNIKIINNDPIVNIICKDYNKFIIYNKGKIIGNIIKK